MFNLPQENNSPAPGANDSIVGLWHVIYTANGALFNESLDMWHSDGTEFENVHLAPAAGNICMGVWKQVAPRTVRLHHIGWLFNTLDPTGNATNTFTIDETNTVAPNGVTYTGTFTFKVYDLNGNYVPNSEVMGTMPQLDLRSIDGTSFATRRCGHWYYSVRRRERLARLHSEQTFAGVKPRVYRKWQLSRNRCQLFLEQLRHTPAHALHILR